MTPPPTVANRCVDRDRCPTPRYHYVLAVTHWIAPGRGSRMTHELDAEIMGGRGGRTCIEVRFDAVAMVVGRTR